MNQLVNNSLYAGSSPVSQNEGGSSDVVEVSLLLSKSQISQLAHQAQRRGMTSAQFLRQCISTLCQPIAENA